MRYLRYEEIIMIKFLKNFYCRLNNYLSIDDFEKSKMLQFIKQVKLKEDFKILDEFMKKNLNIFFYDFNTCFFNGLSFCAVFRL